jgi:phage recombination protein Bet
MENTPIIFKQKYSLLLDIKKQVGEAQIEYIQKTLFPTLNQNETLITLYKAQQLGLDVLNGEVTAYTANGKNGRQLVFIVGKDGKARRALSTGKLEYAKKESVYMKVDKDGKRVRVNSWEGGQLWSAIAIVKRTDQTEPHTVEAIFSEYNQGKNQWLDKPNTMIQKVALSQAYTEAFPELFAGVYDESEMPNNPRDLEVQNGVVIDENKITLDDDSIAKINATKSLDELKTVCRSLTDEKGIEYKQEIINLYGIKKEELSNGNN